MFNGNLGFNPYDKNTNNAFDTDHCKMRGQFISSFGPQQIYCYNGNPRKKISSMAHTDNLTTAVHANLNNDSDVYFYVNGGRKQYAINEVRACFVDIDAGRDANGNYLEPSRLIRFIVFLILGGVSAGRRRLLITLLFYKVRLVKQLMLRI